jgi:hypothetical protein
VSNTAQGLASELLPAGTPRAALICRYDGSNGKPFNLIWQQHLDTAQAASAARQFRALPLSHAIGGVTTCPLADGSTGYIAFAYAGDQSVDVRVDLSGCAYVSNGHIRTTAGDTSRLFGPP